VGYDPATNTLEVEFLNGSIYHYFNVPPSIYSGLMSASSHGSYLDQYVTRRAGTRTGRFGERLVDERDGCARIAGPSLLWSRPIRQRQSVEGGQFVTRCFKCLSYFVGHLLVSVSCLKTQASAPKPDEKMAF
jgi:hypothetical protein